MWPASSGTTTSGSPTRAIPTQLVSFGTSGHRGSPLHGSFTEAHILAITQAICDYRRSRGIDGPLYHGQGHARGVGPGAAERARGAGRQRGRDHHPARRRGHADAGHLAGPSSCTTAAAQTHLADGIVITPSHNPARRRRLQVQPTQRRAGRHRRDRLGAEARANELLRAGNAGVKRMPFAAALKAADHARGRLGHCPTSGIWETSWTWTPSASAGLELGVDPLGGAAAATGSRSTRSTGSISRSSIR